MVKNKFKIITIALFVACMIGFSSVAKADMRWVTFYIGNAKLPVREMLLYLQTFLCCPFIWSKFHIGIAWSFQKL